MISKGDYNGPKKKPIPPQTNHRNRTEVVLKLLYRERGSFVPDHTNDYFIRLQFVCLASRREKIKTFVIYRGQMDVDVIMALLKVLFHHLPRFINSLSKLYFLVVTCGLLGRYKYFSPEDRASFFFETLVYTYKST
jgi:hypothetical protein